MENVKPSLERLIKRWETLIVSDPPTECRLCSHTFTQVPKKHVSLDIFHAGELIRYECPECNVIFGDLRFLNLPLEEIGNDYIDLHTFYNEGDTSGYVLQVIKKIVKLTGLNKKKFLDYACGSQSKTIDKLVQHGYNVKGYDEYTTSPNPSPLENETFDVVYSNNFIEHVIDPVNDVKKMLKYLKKNGRLVLISACWEYKIAYTHYHTFFFIGKSVKILAEKVGIREIYTKKITFLDGESTIVKVFVRTI